MKPTRNPFVRNALIATAVSSIACGPTTLAAVITWGNAATPTNYNSGTFDWNTAGNWAAGAGPVPSGTTTVAQLKGNTSQTINLTISSPFTIGAISRAGSQTNFVLSGSDITMDGTGQTTVAGTNTAGSFVSGEAAIMSNQNNSTFVNLTVNNNIIMLNTNLGIGGRSGTNSGNNVTIGGNITNGDTVTRQLNIRGALSNGVTNTQINGSIGATLGTGGGGITINNLTSGNAAVNLAGAIGAATGTGAAVTISNTATGTGTFNISGAIGQTVSTITQNSTTSVTTLSGNNASFGGTITVTSGALSFLKTTAKSGTTTVANGATLGLGVGGATNPFLSGDVDSLFANTLSGVTMGATSNVGIDTTNGNFTYATNVASTTKGLNKLGGNTLILTGTNAYTGPTIITGGILQIGNAGSTGSLSTSSAITNNAQITFKRSDGILQGTHFSSAGISGTGSLVKDGAGTLTLNASNTYGGTTTVSAGTLKIASGGSFTTTVSNANSLVVGNAAGNSLLHIQSGGTGTASRLQVGTINGGNGAIYNQGTLTVSGTANVGNFALGYATGAYGYYRHDTSTTTSVNEIGIGTSSATTTANLGGNGVMDVLQGKVAPVSSAVNGGWFSMNRGDATQYSQLNISGGTFELANSATQVGLFMNNNDTQNNKGGHAVINVSGTGSLTSSGTATELDLMRISGTNTTSTAMLGVLNIGSGGTVQTNVIKATQTLGTALVNFHGGTLKANNTGVVLLGGSNIDGAYVYSGGAIIDTNGTTVTISQNLLAPDGSGVSSIPVTANGTGYIGRPVVYLTGGGGTGATAVADFNPTTGEVTGITITNPGTGYTSAPTVNFSGGGGTAPTLGTITTAANSSGGLTKSNTGTLTLSGANTYSGATTIQAGTLKLSASSTNNISSSTKIIVGDTFANNSAKLDVTGLTGGTLALTGSQALAGHGTVIGGASAASGTHIAPGNNGIGSLTFDGSGTAGTVLNMASESIFDWDLSGNDSTSDQVSFWNYNASEFVLNGNTVNVNLSGTKANGTYTATLFKFFSDSGTTTFDSGITSGLTLGTLGSGISSASFTYNGSTIGLSYTVVPEPTSALAGLLITAGLLRRRRC